MGGNIGAGFSHKYYASSDDLEKLGQLGEIYRVNGIPYKLVQVHTSCTNSVIAPGEVVYFTATENVVTNTVSAGVSNSVDHYAGVAPSDLAASVPQSVSSGVTYYMLIQVGGRHSAVKTNGDDDIAAGDQVIAIGNGTCDSAAAGTAIKPSFIGSAAAADVDASNTVAVNMRFCG